jgi:hypothetical protein
MTSETVPTAETERPVSVLRSSNKMVRLYKEQSDASPRPPGRALKATTR